MKYKVPSIQSMFADMFSYLQKNCQQLSIVLVMYTTSYEMLAGLLHLVHEHPWDCFKSIKMENN